MSTAVNIFLRQCLIHEGLPFQVNQKKKLKKLLKSMDEAENLLKDPKAKAYDTVEDLVKDLEKMLKILASKSFKKSHTRLKKRGYDLSLLTDTI